MSMPDKIWAAHGLSWNSPDEGHPASKPYISQAAHERAIKAAVEAEREACAKKRGTLTMDDTGWDDGERGPKMALVETPSRTIWKYQIPVLEEFTVPLPDGAQIIRFENEGGKLWMWAVVTPTNPVKPLRVLAFKTGAEMPSDNLHYLGCAAIFIQAELMLYYFTPTEGD